MKVGGNCYYRVGDGALNVRCAQVIAADEKTVCAVYWSTIYENNDSSIGTQISEVEFVPRAKVFNTFEEAQESSR